MQKIITSNRQAHKEHSIMQIKRSYIINMNHHSAQNRTITDHRHICQEHTAIGSKGRIHQHKPSSSQDINSIDRAHTEHIKHTHKWQKNTLDMASSAQQSQHNTQPGQSSQQAINSTADHNHRAQGHQSQCTQATSMHTQATSTSHTKVPQKQSHHISCTSKAHNTIKKCKHSEVRSTGHQPQNQAHQVIIQHTPHIAPNQGN